jgi:UDP-N-acetylmuramate--alanine ligase
MSGPLAGRKLHFIAIGGAGMSGLALVCHGLGAEVSGSDQAESTYMERLRQAGLGPLLGHDPDQVPADAEVVVSTAVPQENLELARARERGQPILHRGELLAQLTSSAPLIAVAGAHGKTTTSGMIAHALRETGADPTFILGGELPGAGSGGGPANAGWGEGGVIVAEADESDGSFLTLQPDVALVTNLELDHHSHWSGEADLREAFRTFAGASRVLVAPQELADGLGGGLGFALERPERPTGGHARSTGSGGGPRPQGPGAGVQARGITPTAGGSEFELVIAGASGSPRPQPLPVRLAVPGHHNVANATAALAALHAAGAGERLPSLDELASALSSFPGMARRLELKGELRGARIYDDYAHHPTEVAAAIAALRELPHSRLIAVFQPHLYSRTKALATRFGQALAAADEIGVLEVYPAREQPIGELAGVSGISVARAAASAAAGRRVLWLSAIERAAEVLAAELGEGDILLSLGAGDVFRLADELLASDRDEVA